MHKQHKTDLHTPPDDALWLLPLGGSGEIGMNLNLYGTAGKWLMVDCGITFGDDLTPGIDIITPDITFIQERAEDLLGIVITHAHEDHFGAIERLWPFLKCPVYAAPFTAALLRAKLAQGGLKGVVPIVDIPNGGSFEVGPFAVEMVRTAHSVPDSHMLSIKTVHGTVVHTGDWRIDDHPVVGHLTDGERLAEIGHEGVLAVVSDSTGAMETEEDASELDVQNGLIECFKEREGRVVVACFSTNTARLKSIAIAAHKSGRYMSMVGRSLWRNAEIANKLGYLPEFSNFLTEHEAMQTPRDKIVMVCTGCQGERRAALSRIAAHDHHVVKFERGDTVFFSARKIPGNELPISRMQNQLVAQGVNVISQEHMTNGRCIHASGHGGQPDFKKLYDWTRPHLIVPVHGELRHQTEHEQYARSLGYEDIMVPTNGQLMRLGPGLHEFIGEVQAGRWGVDGKGLKPLDKVMTQNRRKMSFNGVSVVTVILDRRGMMHSEPQVTLIGVDDDAATHELRNHITDALYDELDRLPRSKLLDDGAVKKEVLRIVRRQLREEKGKRPVVEAHIVRV